MRSKLQEYKTYNVRLKRSRVKIADLHNHTLLSPCASLEMTPAALVKRAKELKIDILGISDHNTTRQVALVKTLADREGIFILQGVEVNTKEDIHCLCFFPNANILDQFQTYIDHYLPNILNRPNLFGDQVQINEDEEIVYEEKRLLLSALDQSIEEVEKETHRLGGLFIPAHINRNLYGLCTQIGFFPKHLKVDALEIFPAMPTPPHLPKHLRILQDSDAHYLNEIGQRTNEFDIENISFESIKEYLNSYKSENK